MNTLQKQQGQPFNQYQRSARREEGSVHVDVDPRNNKDQSMGKNGGEYIDYEIVK